jgi:integrase
VQTITEPGRYPDGGNLYLQVQVLPDEHITKSWIFRYMSPDGRRPEMGLGPVIDVSLADARSKATEYRQMLRDGLDPLQERRQKRQEARLAASRSIKFKDCCAAYIEAHAPAWRNAKHKTQWETTRSTYAYPVMGHLTVSDVGTDHMLRVLEPIWNTKRETARRLRARIERVLSWAATRGYRSDSNPARWDGNLKNLLAADSKTQPVRHHPALPYREVKDFARKLRKHLGVAARALEFTILTAARTSEVILARWDEVNLKRKEWVMRAFTIIDGLLIALSEGAPRTA